MTRLLLAFPAALLIGMAGSSPASAHCDTVKGPVVAAARTALAQGDVNLVLHWVRPEDEAAVRTAFERVLAARRSGGPATEVADRYFFETLVRIHRAGEGASYTGLSEDDPVPIILATDRALEQGSADELEQQLVLAVTKGLAQRFDAANRAKHFRPGDVGAGRAYVASYVGLTHWVEGVFGAAEAAGEHHAQAGEHHAQTPEHHAVPAAHGETGPGARGHGTSPQLLPWLLAAALATAAGVEGVFLFRRRRREAPAG